MKFYIVLWTGSEIEFVTFQKKSFTVFRDQAFEFAKQYGQNACVYELTMSDSWNMKEILEEEKCHSDS